ncbi:acyltransferase family protein [Roseateles paludis]|uniref:Acyltransferase n=1 Tax=Roseateles paludis TaxID=3145238 RepID=A0ABV0G6N2_9BURK
MTTTSDASSSPNAVEEKRAYVHSLDGVRGLAALAVVLYHVEYFHAWFARGYLAVDLFFILSGFVLTHRYGQQIERRGSFGRFALARLARLYPLHFATLAVLALAELVLGHYGKHAVIQGDLGYSLIMNLLLLQAVGFSDSPSWNTSAWSISAEFWFNLLWALLLAVPLIKRFITPLFALAWAVGLMLLIQHSVLIDYHMEKIGGMTTALLRCAVGFSCGALIYGVRQQAQRFSRWAAVAGLIAVLLVVALKPEYMDYWVVAFVFPLLIIASLASAHQSWWVTFLEWKPVAWLGVISYSVYLNHLLVIKAVNLVASKLDLLSRGALIVVVVLALSAFTYRFVEAPARRWLVSLAGRSSGIQVPA